MIDGPEHITNLTNYSGLFQTGVSYKKFDFVYNTGDARFYYARDDMTYAGGAIMEGSNRFFIEPEGPQENGMPTHYIYDDLNELVTLNNQIDVGHIIHLTGTLYNSDGYYKVIDYYRDVDSPEENVSVGTVQDALDATYAGAEGWYESSWFILSKPNSPGSETQIDSRTYYVPDSAVPGWIHHSLLGWIYVSLSSSGGNEVWFWLKPGGGQGNTNSEGFWFHASSDIVSSSSLIYLNQPEYQNYGLDFGPVDNWISLQKSHLPDYEIVFFNYGNSKWYGIKGKNSSIDILNTSDYPSSAVAPAPAPVSSSRIKDGVSARIQIQGVYEDTFIKQYEAPSDNFISIKSIVQDLSSEQSSWSKDLFFFDADYGSTVNLKANNYKYEYGNGYYTLQPKGINALSFQANLQFKNRTNREANAIIHFLENHQGQHEKDTPSLNLKYSQGISGFRWDGNATFHPYDSPEIQSKAFYCQEFSHSLNFENSNDINVKLVNYDTSILRKSDGLFLKRPEDYSVSGEYGLNDIVFETGNHQYYYCHSGDGFDTASGLDPVAMNSEWSRESGYFKEINTGFWTRDFFWEPSVGLTVSQNPRMNNLMLDGAYNQVYRDGINESLLNLDLQFNNRSDEEAYGILHFLEQHYGSIPFQFSAPAPYEVKKNFVCQEWNHAYNFKDNHSISAKFEEFPINLSSERLLNNITPSPKAPAEIIMSSLFIIGDEDDGFLWNETQRRRITVENIGGYDAEVLSLFFEEAGSKFFIVGKKSFGESYMTSGFDGTEPITVSTISTIYSDIIGSSITTEISEYYQSKRNWTTRDLCEAILNRSEFLESSPSQAFVEILYLDLLEREVGTGEDISYWLGLNSISDVVEGIMLSEEYINLEKNNIKIISTKINPNDMKVIIPDHQMVNAGLNGVEVIIKRYDGNLQEFYRTDDGREYRQYNNGHIQQINLSSLTKGETIECDYFVNDKIFKKFGNNILKPDSQGYIDIQFKNKSSSLISDYLEDSEGNTITWTNSFEEPQGNIKIESSNTWIYANLNLIWEQGGLNSVVKTWVSAEQSLAKQVRVNPWLIDVNEAHQDYLDKSLELIPAPRIKIPLGEELQPVWENCKVPVTPLATRWLIQNSNVNISSLTSAELENLEQFGDDRIVQYETVVIEVDFIPRNSEKAIFFEGMWASFEVIIYNTDDGGMLLPRELSNQNINEISSWVDSSNLAYKTIINNSDQTVLSVEEIALQDLPDGYVRGTRQLGMCRLSEDILESEKLIGKKAKIEIKLFSGTSIGGTYIPGGAGNLEVFIGESVTEYGIIKQDLSQDQQLTFKYDIQGSTDYIANQQPMNATIDGIEVRNHPDLKTWMQSGTSNQLLGYNVVPSYLGGGIPNSTLLHGLNMTVTNGSGFNGSYNALNSSPHYAYGVVQQAIKVWIEDIAANATILSEPPTYDITYGSQGSWGMFKVNDVYVPDMPEFVDWLHDNYPSGIPYNRAAREKWGLVTVTMNGRWNGYDDLLSGGKMHGGSGVTGSIPWYTNTVGTEAFHNFSKYHAMLRLDSPSRQTNDQAMIDWLMDNSIVGQFIKDISVVSGNFSTVNYKIINKSGELHQVFKDLPQAVVEWNRLRDEKFLYRKVVFEDELGETRKSAHVISLNFVVDDYTVDQDGELVVNNEYLDQDSLEKLSALNQAYEEVPHVDYGGVFSRIAYGIERSPLPVATPSGTGLKINRFYYIDLTVEQKREIELAISKAESIVNDDITMNLYISEDPTTRLGASFNESAIATFFGDQDKDYIVGGMKSINGSNFSRRVSGIYNINPKYLFDFDFNKDVDENYEPEKLSPLYYVTLHEVIHMLGVGRLWFLGHVYDGIISPIKHIGESPPASGSFYDYWFKTSTSELRRLDSNGDWVIRDSSVAQLLLYKAIRFSGTQELGEIDFWQEMPVEYKYLYLLARDDFRRLTYFGENGSSKFKEMCSSRGIENNQAFEIKGHLFNKDGVYETELMPIGPYSNQALADHVSEYPYQYEDKDDIIRFIPAFKEELMTPLYKIAPAVPAVLSRMTIGLLEDLGYNVDYSQAKANDDPYLTISLPDDLV
jgi:phage-related protein